MDRLAYEVAAGGVESMGQFKSWFFPGGDGDTSLYCRYNYKSLQAYSALMHFTGSIASIAASYFTQHWGRKGYVSVYQGQSGVLLFKRLSLPHAY